MRVHFPSLLTKFRSCRFLCIQRKLWIIKGEFLEKDLKAQLQKKEGIIKSQNILVGIPHFIDRQPASVEGMTRIVQAKMKVIERGYDRDQ